MTELLDTAGQEDFDALRPSWMQDKDGYLMVFALNAPHTLNELKPFFDLHRQINADRDVAVVLVGNKKDIATKEQLAASREAAVARAQEMGARYIETSASTGENVKEAFEAIIRDIRTLRNPGAAPAPAAGGGSCCEVM